MLVHIPCKCTVILSHAGKGKCPACGKEINVRVSNK